MRCDRHPCFLFLLRRQCGAVRVEAEETQHQVCVEERAEERAGGERAGERAEERAEEARGTDGIDPTQDAPTWAYELVEADVSEADAPESVHCPITLCPPRVAVEIDGSCFDAQAIATYIQTTFDTCHPLTRQPFSVSDLWRIDAAASKDGALLRTCCTEKRSAYVQHEKMVAFLEDDVVSLDLGEATPSDELIDALQNLRTYDERAFFDMRGRLSVGTKEYVNMRMTNSKRKRRVRLV